VLAEQPDTPGTLGIAISEAVEEAVQHPDTNYSLGSVLNHVLLHQSVIGQEAKLQMEKLGCYPDLVIGCHGGGVISVVLLPLLPMIKCRGKRCVLLLLSHQPVPH